MTRKSFVAISILSIIAMYASSVVDALFSDTLLGGQSGFPFKDSSTTIFGGGTTDYLLMTLNIFFWFLVILGLWKLLQKIKSKK